MNSDYIAIEGLEGAGKTTAMKAIKDFFSDRKIETVREPGGTGFAEQIRNLVKEGHSDEPIDLDTETLLFFASRNQLLTQIVVPYIEKGLMIVSDRCFLSSLAYQNSELANLLTDRLAIKPDLIIYMDISPEVGLQRATIRGELDRIEKRKIEFFKGARKFYKQYAEEHDNVISIDAHGSIEEVYALIYAQLEKTYN